MALSEQDLLWLYNPTKTAFEVKWGGFPYSLQSGEKKILPRFIAEHFTKHLADAILMHREKQLQDADPEHKPKPLLNHPIERPRVVNMINLGVYTYFQQGSAETAEAQVARIVNEANSGKPIQDAPVAPEQDEQYYEDFGLVPDKSMGNLAPTPPPAQPVSDVSSTIAAPAPEAPVNDGALRDDAMPAVSDQSDPVAPTAAKPKRTKKELLEEADTLGLVPTGKETVEALEQMIKNF